MDDPITVLERLLAEDWPTYRSNDHSRLWTLAREAYDRKTFDGYLSYVLITSQACEDFARLLLKEAQFTLQVCLAMKGFGWTFPKRQTGTQLDSLMFGQLLELLDHSIAFDQKQDFIAACRKLSSVRNRLAHELDSGISLSDIQALANECSELEKDIIDCFNSADENFFCFYANVLGDAGWDELLGRRIRTATPTELTALETLAAKLYAARK